MTSSHARVTWSHDCVAWSHDRVTFYLELRDVTTEPFTDCPQTAVTHSTARPRLQTLRAPAPGFRCSRSGPDQTSEPMPVVGVNRGSL